MAYEISLMSPLSNEEQENRGSILEAVQRRISIAFALTRMGSDICGDEIEALLFDMSSMVDALLETRESGERIVADALSSKDLVNHAETLRLALEAIDQNYGGLHVGDLEPFASGLKQELERVCERENCSLRPGVSSTPAPRSFTTVRRVRMSTYRWCRKCSLNLLSAP